MIIISNADNSAVKCPPITNKARVRAILGACSGNLVEWYDFFIYAYTSIYFASLFFPAGDQNSQLLATAGIFAVGFFMRPLGGWIFGYIADTRGRKISMIISIFMMCGGSLMIAIMPTYEIDWCRGTHPVGYSQADAGPFSGRGVRNRRHLHQ